MALLLGSISKILDKDIQDLDKIVLENKVVGHTEYAADERIYLVDGIEPFFQFREEGETVNYSKIPFGKLDKFIESDQAKLDKITSDFDVFAAQVSEMGFNSISLDNVIHLYVYDGYRPELKEKLAKYAEFYQGLFNLAEKYELKVFLTTDIAYINDEISKDFPTRQERVGFMQTAITDVLDSYPQVSGVIVRVGEPDGVDVNHEFHSEISILTVVELQNFFKAMLPEFEARDRMMIFRNWSVGFGELGDLLWNPERHIEVFSEIESENLVISSKFAPTDFARNQEFNENLLLGNHKKIIELQTRLEYQGFGNFPSYVGTDYYEYFRRMQNHPGFYGMSVWTSTGGWSKFAKNTLTGNNTSIWNQANIYTAIGIFRHELSAEEALRTYSMGKLNLSEGDAEKFSELMTLSVDIIKNGYYLKEYSSTDNYVLNAKLPSSLHIYWDNVTISNILAEVYKQSTSDIEAVLRQSQESIAKVERQLEIAEGLDDSTITDHVQDLLFLRDFLVVDGEIRKYMFDDNYDVEIVRTKVKQFEDKYPNTYEFSFDIKTGFSELTEDLLIRTLFGAAVGEKQYEVKDQLILSRTGKRFLLFLMNNFKSGLPSFLEKNAASLDEILKS